MPRGRQKVCPVVRFWNQVRKSNRCWTWIGALDGDGYGQFTNGEGKNVRAHRFSWEIHRGSAGGLRVLHTCDNPSCVNPKHLFLGTDDDNLKDAIRKGRLVVKGEGNAAARLKEEDVLFIRKTYRQFGPSSSNKHELAEMFGITAGHFRQIIERRSWKHI